MHSVAMRGGQQAKHAIAMLVVAVIAISAFTNTTVHSKPEHGIAMYGAPALPPDFTHLPYANPNAPKGGRIVFGESGRGFDNFNPYVIKGRAPWGVRAHVYESLLGRNWDEPFSLYGLLAESVETNAERSFVQFTLRPNARFANGDPVTTQDVLWSFETLAERGLPSFAQSWSKVARAEIIDDRRIRFTFNSIDRELPLILGLRPILQQAAFEGLDFTATAFTVPNGTGPYILADYAPNQFIVFQRNPNYWGRDLPFNRGRHNVDEIRYDYFADSAALFEAFKAGEITSYRENNAAKWNTQYTFPAIKNGTVVKSLIPHQRPSGIRGFVFNTRKPIFADWRVRDALLYAFNFEFINRVLNDASEPRITSYFANSVFAMQHNRVNADVLALLAPYEHALLPDALSKYTMPTSNPRTAVDRNNIRYALRQLQRAGWTVDNDGVLRNAAGNPFTFEILLKTGDGQALKIINIYVESLRALGISPTIKRIDDAQYKQRTNEFDFDMTFYWRALSLSPGNEQYAYWGKNSANTAGSRNWMGVQNPAIDAAIATALAATNQNTYRTAIRALDRILTTGRYVIPLWYSKQSKLAHNRALHYPKQLPMYGDWIGFQPDVWWFEQ